MFRHARWLVGALLLGGAVTVKAQEFPLAPLIARLPGSTRALGMANADAGGRESDVIFYNPAQLAVAHGTGASAEFYHEGNLLVTLSTVLDLGPGTIGVGVQSLTFSNSGYSFAPPGALDASGPIPSSGLILALGYAQRLFGLRAGVNAKLLEQEIGSTRDNRGSLDFGLSRDLLNGTLGLSLQNVGPAFRSSYGTVSQPTRTSFGFTSDRYLVGPFDVIGAATTSLVRGRDFIAGGGGEILYSWLDGYSVAGRAGVRRAAEGEGPWTVGFGITADRVSLDYAFESRFRRPGAHRIGVRIR